MIREFGIGAVPKWERLYATCVLLQDVGLTPCGCPEERPVACVGRGNGVWTVDDYHRGNLSWGKYNCGSRLLPAREEKKRGGL